MADPKELPESTDAVIAGASTTESEEALIVREPTARDKAIDKLRGSTDKISGQAADKARELVGQGLERGGEALANVSKLVGDTASSSRSAGRGIWRICASRRFRAGRCRRPPVGQKSGRTDRRYP